MSVFILYRLNAIGRMSLQGSNGFHIQGHFVLDRHALVPLVNDGDHAMKFEGFESNNSLVILAKHFFLIQGHCNLGLHVATPKRNRGLLPNKGDHPKCETCWANCFL
jgi:hypothetical protein